jgi:acyl-[acyl-carrier-protein] desaturase
MTSITSTTMTAGAGLPGERLLAALEPTAARLLDRHLAHSKEWFPHELVPWARASEFPAGWRWSPEESGLPAAVRSSLFVNLLTEDNLPYYFRTAERVFGRDTAWGAWVRRWTAEEARHSIVLRDYLTVTRAVDPVALERARVAHMSLGRFPEPETVQETLVYTTLQELATRIAHHGTGRLLDDGAGHEIMKRVAADENYHYLFYRDAATVALDVDPSGMVQAVERQVRHFAMPGGGIADFAAHARAIERAGIYSYQVHHDQVLVPVVLRHWDLESLTGLSEPAERARDRVLDRIARIGTLAARVAERRAGAAGSGE